MISAWDVYWVMQMDSINAMLFFGSAACVVAPAFAGIVSDGDAVWDDEEKRLRPWVWRVFILLPVIMVLATMAPSTKTAAAMVVLPAIANNETLQHEAGDLYRLAKKALSDAVGAEPEAKE